MILESDYDELIDDIHKCNNCCDGLIRPTSRITGYHNNKLNPEPIVEDLWSIWQGSKEAKVMIVGQDWGDEKYLRLCLNDGRFISDIDANATCTNLISLMNSIGIEILRPSKNESNPSCYFCNVVKCIRIDKMTGKPIRGKVEDWARSCGPYTKRLIDIISPSAVIALGRVPFESILHEFLDNESANYDKSKEFMRKVVGKANDNYPYRLLVESTHPFLIKPGTRLFPVYHCGARVVNCTRSMDKQIDDWTKIKEHLN